MAAGSSWPWAVQVLLLSSGGEFRGLCGGTLVQPTRVVTSGSCTTTGDDIFVIANTKELADPTAPLISVTNVRLAPSWAPTTARDVATLTLSEAPDPAIPIGVLGSGEGGDFPTSAAAQVAGWGTTEPATGDPSLVLRQGQVTLTEGCGETGLRCSTTTTEPCFGDIGGPVIVQLGADTVSKDPSPENGTWRLVAIPIAGTSDCTELLYADLTQPEIRAFIEAPDEVEQPSGGGNPAPPPSPPAPSPIPPPQTKLKKAQIDAGKGTAGFRFKGSGNLAGFQCALASSPHKKAKFKSCRSPKRYRNLAPGNYTFQVRAIGPGGPDPTPAKKRFTIR